ncbi:MAG: SMC family ATPase [Calditrichaeota bacterium]|nr:SMC family ATPase [Calditrichota bacterium]
MIPIHLTFKGLYSYQQQQEIDFRKLSEAQLFGIFGPVGSGKSAILEAISFALYGETERLNKRDNRYYNMMNLKSTELFIQFTFKAGEEFREEYLFEVRGKRQQKHFEKVNPFERRTLQRIDGEWQPKEISAEAILGLSYENFRRTIIIPQGKFQEFLQLSDADRTRMLKEIFNLQRFELYPKVVMVERENHHQIDRIEGQLLELGETEEATIAEKQAQCETLRRELAELETARETLSRQEKTLSDEKARFEKIAALRRELETLRAGEPEFRERQEALDAYQYCLIHFREGLGRQRDYAGQIERLETVLAEKRERQGTLEPLLKEREKDFARLKHDYQQRDHLMKEADELDRLIRLRQAEAALRELAAEKSRLEEAAQRAEADLQQLLQEDRQLGAQLKAQREQARRSEMFSEIQAWYEAAERLQEDRAGLSEEQAQLREEIARQSEAARELLGGTIGNIFQSLTVTADPADPGQALKDLQRALAVAEAAQAEKLRHWRVQAQLEEYAAALEDGQPCPLCGATAHPAIFHPDDVNKHLASGERAQAELHSQQQAVADAMLALTRLETARETQQKRLQAVETKLAALQKQQKKQHKAFAWPEFDPDDRAAFEQARAGIDKLNAEIAAGEQRKETLEAELETARQQHDRQQQHARELAQQHGEKLTEVRLLADQFRRVKPEALAGDGDDALREQAATLRRRCEQLEAAYQLSETELQALRQELDTLRGESSAIAAQLKAQYAALAEVTQALQDTLTESPYPDFAAVATILATELDIDSEKQAIDTFYRQLHADARQLEQLEAAAEGKAYDPEAHAALVAELNELQEQLRRQHQALGALENALKALSENLLKKTELLKTREALQLRGDNIRILKGMFKGSGFVNFVSAVFLQNLCNAANARFHQLTRRRLQLEVTESNDFQVRDFLNDGQVRSVKTLSGGQTFQASLCLALALADQVQKLSSAEQNFFFLDEGFGTLDREALQVVFETLKSLRKEKRVVGVISHVEELQQEIDVCLWVRNDETKGSQISASWV